jgi:hypothetical protein
LLSRLLPSGDFGIAALAAALIAAIAMLLPIAIIIYMLKFSKRYPDRVTQHESDAASPV